MGNEEIRDKAFKDYKEGMKYKEIAEKYGVSLSAVKSWATRYWRKEECIHSEKKLQPKKKNVASQVEKSCNLKKKKIETRGAPKGNRNAAGNRGGAAPEKNKNAETHGAYSKVYWDSLDEDELNLIDSMDDAEEQQLIMQLQMFSVRERRLMRSIKKYRELDNENRGLAVKAESKTKKVEDVTDFDGKSVGSGKYKKVTETSVTNTEAVMNSIMTLETELTKVQRAKTKAIEVLSNYRMEKVKLKNESAGTDVVDDWIEAVLGEDVAGNE